MDVYSRSSNLIIKGLPERSAAEMATSTATLNSGETVLDTQESVALNVIRFCNISLGIGVRPGNIAVAHHLKSYPKDIIRLIIIRFANGQIIDSVYMTKKLLKNNKDRICSSEHLMKKTLNYSSTPESLYARKRSALHGHTRDW